MEAHTVPKVVADRVKEEEEKKNTRRVYTSQNIREVCDYGRQHGAAAAARKYGVDTRRAQSWLQEFRSSKWSSYPEVKSRGRRGVFTEGMQKELVNAIEITRAEAGAPITSGKTAAYAQGLVLKNNAALLVENGGSFQFGKSWARRFLQKQNYGVYRKTTDRTISSTEVAEAANPFFMKVREISPDRDNLYNVDEFYCLLANDGMSWTWQKKGDKKVVIRAHRVGCTMAVLTSAGGTVLGCQLIWEGKTSRCEADVPQESRSDDIWQNHNAESHFQNGETWNTLFQETVIPRLCSRKRTEQRACVLVDAAPQHKFTDETAKLLEEAGVWVVQIPERATHVYQAADQHIISCLKTAMVKGWESYIRLVFANESMSEAVRTIHTRNATHLKKMKYLLLKKALATISERTVQRSWDMTGVMRAVYNDVPRTHVMLDEHITPPSVIDVDEELEVSSVVPEAPEDPVTLEVGDLLINPSAIPNVPVEFRYRKASNEEKGLLKEENRVRKGLVLEEMHERERLEECSSDDGGAKKGKKRCKQCGHYGHMAKTCSSDDHSFEHGDGCLVLYRHEWLTGQVEEVGGTHVKVRLAPPYEGEEWEVPMQYLKLTN